ncbi:MAG TPA: ABC transporter permease, partial [Acidimicrobiia bacterium]
MTAVWYRFRAELRDKWKGVLALALLAGFAGGATLAAIAGARRTDSAFSRLLVDTNAAHLLVNPDYGDDSHLDARAVARLPMVTRMGREQGVIVLPLGVDNVADVEHSLDLASDGKGMYSIGRLHVLKGRSPDPSRVDEVLANGAFARRYGLRVGDHFLAAIMTREVFQAINDAGLSFSEGVAAVGRGEYGTKVRLHLVGIGVTPDEIVVDEGFENREMVFTPAFLRRYPNASAGFFGLAVRLRRGVADIPAFKRAVQELPHDGAIEFQTMPVTAAKVARAVRPQVGALSVFAIVIALTGFLLVGQAMARQTFLESVDHPTLRALGLDRRQLVSGSMVRAAMTAVPAAMLAVVIAFVASPLTPIGAARTAEPDLGVFVDGPVLVLGFVTVGLAVLVLAAIPAWWYTRPTSVGTADQPVSRPSRLAGLLRASGASLAAGTGVRMALEPGRGRTAVPVRTTIVGAALAVATVVAALTFASSLDHLVSTPRLYGWSWDVRVETSGDTSEAASALHTKVATAMAKSKQVTAFADSVISRVDLEGLTVTALGVARGKGHVGPT